MPYITIAGKKIKCVKGKPLLEAFEKAKIPDSGYLVAAILDNRLVSLNSKITRESTVEPVYLNSTLGLRVYERSISLIISKVAKDLFPENQLNLKYSLNKGVYGEFEKKKPISADDLAAMEERFASYVKADLPFVEKQFSLVKVKKILSSQNDKSKFHLIKFYDRPNMILRGLDNYWSYLPGPLLPRTGIIKQFEIIPYEDGFIVRFPDLIEANQLPPYENQRKIYDVYAQFSRWLSLLDIRESGHLNEMIEDGRFSDFLKVCEAIQEKEISDIADEICNKRENPRLVLISGPSSSGKTTFSKRLGIQLLVNGVKPVLISLDNYYKNREEIPRTEDGKYDFESLYALDLDEFNRNILDLFAGREVLLPLFSFIQGKRLPAGKKMRLKENEIIVVEGIHGLNPELSRLVPSSDKFRIYVSPLTQVPIDHTNRFPTADNRLIRRIVRDAKYRGYEPERTIRMWEQVREGEERNIFPFQENADALFNSALIYELNIFRNVAFQLLQSISPFEKEYADAQYLLELLRNYRPFPCDEIPPTSILREFIGGSSFNYK